MFLFWGLGLCDSVRLLGVEAAYKESVHDPRAYLKLLKMTVLPLLVQVAVCLLVEGIKEFDCKTQSSFASPVLTL